MKILLLKFFPTCLSYDSNIHYISLLYLNITVDSEKRCYSNMVASLCRYNLKFTIDKAFHPTLKGKVNYLCEGNQLNI